MEEIPHGLPDPRRHDLPWHNGKPSMLAWWKWAQENGVTFPEMYRRFALNHLYSEACPTLEAIELLASLGPVVEVGAGGGYWSRLVEDVGGDVVTTDKVSPSENGWYHDLRAWKEPLLLTARQAVEAYPGRTIFSCWPPRPSGYLDDLLGSIRVNSTLALITNGRVDSEHDPLYDILESNWALSQTVEIPTWPYRNDKLFIWVGPN